MRTAGTDAVPDRLATARLALVEAGRALATQGLVSGTSGNLSLRRDETLLVTPTGAVLGELEPEMLTVVNLEGTVLSGRLAPTSELALHLEVYRRYPTGAVVHAHPRVATALACVLDELPCIHPDMLDLGGSVRVAPYRQFGSSEFATVTADALADRRAALMSNHGAIAIGDVPAQAVSRIRALEWSADVYWHAAALGTPRSLSSSQQAAVDAAIQAMGYGRTRPLD